MQKASHTVFNKLYKKKELITEDFIFAIYLIINDDETRRYRT